MSENAVEQELTGKIIGYVENLKTSTSLVKALIQVGSKVIGINISFLQYEYISEDNPIGSTVKIKFHDGEWFLETRHAQDSPILKSGANALKALGHAAGAIKARSDRPGEDMSAVKPDVEGDLRFIINTVGTIDMGIEAADDNHIRMIEARYLDEADMMMEMIGMPVPGMMARRKRLAQATN